jgi:phosphoglycerol transferase MdoB-like AlkP superfamily enzyme
MKWLPKLFRFLLVSVTMMVGIFTILRVIFFFVFRDPHATTGLLTVMISYYIGLKFDMRLALLIHSPILFLAWIKPVNIITTKIGRLLWSGYLTLVIILLFILYSVDFGHYADQGVRMDATVFSLLYNFGDSLKVIWQTFPVLRIVVLLFLIITSYGWFINRTIIKIQTADILSLSWCKKSGIALVFILIYLFGIYGKFSYYPLRWSDAFFTNDYFVSTVALNPVLYIADTYKNRDSKYDLELVKKYYETASKYMGVDIPDKSRLKYARVKNNTSVTSNRPNIVLVFLESFAYYKTGVSGNPLSPTPNFDVLAKNSILFTRYYVPHGGTARSVFTAITGMPDVELNKTTSRNPLAVKQHTIINAFKGYEKYYFLGGSANWGEIRGLLTYNIKDLHVYDEGSYSSPRVDVWGISDLSLFEEANRVLAGIGGKMPFLAIIHTSGDHMPYTIPKDNRGFQIISNTGKEFEKYGFRSVDAYNSLRFMDHCIGFFIETAKKEAYFNNTIFVFFGDHGLHRRCEHMQKSEDQLMLGKYHVPLMIYAPGIIKEGKRYNKVASSMDLLPTISSLTTTPYVNSTFGRDLLDERFDGERYAFTIFHQANPNIGLIGDQFYFSTSANGKNRKLHKIYSDTPTEDVSDLFPEVSKKMEDLCQAIYETTRYLRYHNSKEDVDAQVTAQNLSD